MERRKSKGCAISIDEWMAPPAMTEVFGGSTKAIEPTSALSESWQQDMAQAIIPTMSCPQSM
jgi:hypothetical protein